MKTPYVNPSRVFRACRDIPNILLTDGPKVREFEEKAADFLGAKHAIATGSGTIALYCAYRSIGVLGKKVAMPSFTWRSTAEAALMAGARPIFFDIDRDTFCLLPEQVEEYCRHSRPPEAVVAVDCFGRPAEYGKLLQYNLVVDSAHSFGSLYKSSDICRYGIHCFSFSPTKVLVANEGGLVTCNDELLAEELKSLRRWAGRMTEFNAACAILGLENLPVVLGAKAEIARKYRKFADKVGWKMQDMGDHVSTSKDVCVVLDSQQERDALRTFLADAGIETKIYFIPVHTLPHFEHCEREDLTNTEEIFQTSLCLPSWPGMDISFVIEKLEEFCLEGSICLAGNRQRTKYASA